METTDALDYIRLRKNHLGISTRFGTLYRASKTALVSRRLVTIAPTTPLTGEEHIWIEQPHVEWALQPKRRAKPLAFYGFVPMPNATRYGIYLIEDHWSSFVRDTLQSALSTIRSNPLGTSGDCGLMRLDATYPFQVVYSQSGTETPLPLPR